MKIFLGITGASGVEFGVEFARVAPQYLDIGVLYYSVSKGADVVFRHEVRESSIGSELDNVRAMNSTQYQSTDLAAKPSSGSSCVDVAIILPCSMNTLAKISAGISDCLITRAVDVCLKERKKVVLCTRETPLNRGHIENMLRAHDKGCQIMPIQHAFYADKMSHMIGVKVTSIDYRNYVMLNFVGRILNQLGIANTLATKWR